MVNKALRIMIAESRHPEALMIERMLNQLGYYRIVPVQSVSELETLSQCLGPELDVLIADARLIASATESPASVVGQCQNALFYESQALGEQLAELDPHRVTVQLHGGVDVASLGNFMALIARRVQLDTCCVRRHPAGRPPVHLSEPRLYPTCCGGTPPAYRAAGSTAASPI